MNKLTGSQLKCDASFLLWFLTCACWEPAAKWLTWNLTPAGSSLASNPHPPPHSRLKWSNNGWQSAGRAHRKTEINHAWLSVRRAWKDKWKTIRSFPTFVLGSFWSSFLVHASLSRKKKIYTIFVLLLWQKGEKKWCKWKKGTTTKVCVFICVCVGGYLASFPGSSPCAPCNPFTAMWLQIETHERMLLLRATHSLKREPNEIQIGLWCYWTLIWTESMFRLWKTQHWARTPGAAIAASAVTAYVMSSVSPCRCTSPCWRSWARAICERGRWKNLALLSWNVTFTRWRLLILRWCCMDTLWTRFQRTTFRFYNRGSGP